jgi:RNA polymerase sigma-70 factor (ECF subfamily)
MSELEEIERLRGRDTEAWDRLYRGCAHRTYRILYHLTKGDGRVLEELNQTVWLAAMETIDNLDAARGTPQDWVLGIARFKALSYLRKKYRCRVVSVGMDVPMSLSQPLSDSADPLQERARVLRACIESLPENWQLVLRQKYEIGLSMKEISDLGGLSVKAVESILSRARNRLRELVRDTMEAGEGP